jgi:hypothetical protein|tara:strand:+ start:6434 stop:6670 length:237 start_codon:yes stop_codon:yes gene_type:complete
MDKINPNYYKNKPIETIEVIRNELTSDEFRGYLKGQVWKYLSRHRGKNGFEDLQKAKWYMDYLIKFEQEMGEGLLIKN